MMIDVLRPLLYSQRI